MIFNLLLLIFLVVLAFHFGVAYILWRNLKLYSLPGTVNFRPLNLTFLIITGLLIFWAAVALLNFL